MVDLFNENTLFVFFFAMVAIYNYSALKEYQRMAIIYISVYALAALDIISIKLGLRRFTKGYIQKQLKMDCQPTEFTALSRHRAVFSWAGKGGIPIYGA